MRSILNVSFLVTRYLYSVPPYPAYLKLAPFVGSINSGNAQHRDLTTIQMRPACRELVRTSN